MRPAQQVSVAGIVVGSYCSSESGSGVEIGMGFIRHVLTVQVSLAMVLLLSVTALQAAPVGKPALASVNAAAAVAGEEGLLFGKNAERPVPIASITKLMTALVVLESGLDMNEWLTLRSAIFPLPPTPIPAFGWVPG